MDNTTLDLTFPAVGGKGVVSRNDAALVFREQVFAGKTAIVTGASKGLGRAIALQLGSHGANVVAVSRTKTDLDDLTLEMRRAGYQAIGIACDVSRPESVTAMAKEVLDNHDCVDMLVNNAGILGEREFVVNYDPVEWDRIMAVNLRGPFLCCQAVLPNMIARQTGKIVNVAAGVMDERVDYGVAAYYASKAALINFTRQLAAEVKRHRVFVNAIDPGGLTTHMSADIMAGEDASDRFAGTQTNKNQLLRLRPPEAVVPMVTFLLSQASDMLTGRLLQATSQDDVQYLQL